MRSSFGAGTRHAELVLAVPGIRGYMQCPRAGRDEQSTAPFDGFSAMWFDDESSITRALESPRGAGRA